MTQLVKASTQLATTLGIEPAMMIETIKSMCFPTMRPENISDAQTAAFISVCATQDLNPLIPGMVYAYPTKSGGVVPVIGPDGVFKKLAERKDVTYECEVYPDDVTQKPTHAKASIFVEGKERPYTFTAIFSEWCVSSNPNWQTRPRHMLWVRAIKQAARQVIHGLPMDDDEAVIAGLKNVTGTAADETPEAAPARPAPAKRRGGVSAAIAEKDAPAAAAAPAPAAVVEAEVVDVAAKPVEQAVAPTPAPEPTPAPAPAAVAEKKATAPVKDTPAAPAEKKADAPVASAAPRTSMKEGERITFERVNVDRFAKKAINGQPSIEAELQGAYTGKVYHIGGAENAAWQIEKPVTVTLLGKKLTSGAVITLVEKLEVSAEADGLSLN